ncbi:hypothetical protein PUR34_05405 [Streptomyces sp. JV185]|uniref:hypothetical protein n=1 Tax=Streptomyces sp. JV185 TaxID=858638 RepID=UPI002E7A58A2|nr:hypothetical protein [Streptomyces sp. JV185]MEE1767627.1 hypothetical protein [Streptomyces sp. JV185]
MPVRGPGGTNAEALDEHGQDATVHTMPRKKTTAKKTTAARKTTAKKTTAKKSATKTAAAKKRSAS